MVPSFMRPALLALAHMTLAGAAPADIDRKHQMIETQATGTFDVTLTPVTAADAPVGGLAIAKTFHGDLAASSAGQMLSVRTPIEGSAGYVAMERVTGTLAGRKGGFALQHSGTMAHGAQSLSITVVPDSGTDALAGIAGSMDIRIEGGRHFYTFRYTLPREE